MNCNKLNVRQGFPRLADKAGREPLTIAYLGASNTALEAGWRPVVHKWFNRNFSPRGRHVEINASIGGTDSLTGAFTCGDIFKEHEPDLVFVEYSQPDINTFGSCRELLGCSVEAIVRKIRTFSPGTDICFLYFLHKSHLEEHKRGLTWSEGEHERIAEYYRVPSINIAKYAVEIDSSGEMDLFPGGENPPIFRADLVHPTHRGNALITGFITGCLKRILKKSVPRQETGRGLPEKLHRYDLGSWKNVEVTPDMLSDGCARVKRHVGQASKAVTYYSLGHETELRFMVKGKLAGFLSVVGPKSGYVRCDTPGQKTVTRNLFNQYCYRDMLAATRLISNVSDIPEIAYEKYRQVSIKLTNDIPRGARENKSGSRPPVMTPDKWEFNPVSLFVMGDVKSA